MDQLNLQQVTLTQEEIDHRAVKAEALRQRELWDKMQGKMYDDIQKLQQYEANPHNAVVRDSVTERRVEDNSLIVNFWINQVPSRQLTIERGETTLVPQEWITIIPPGLERELTRNSPIEAYDTWRFPREYRNFKSGITQQQAGTSLGDWAVLKNEPAVVHDFERIGIKYVEQLAIASEQSAHYVAHFTNWKNKAKAFVEENTKSKAQLNLEAVLRDRDTKHAEEMEAMNKKIDQLIGLLAQKADATQETVDAEPVATEKKSYYKRKTGSDE